MLLSIQIKLSFPLTFLTCPAVILKRFQNVLMVSVRSVSVCVFICLSIRGVIVVVLACQCSGPSSIPSTSWITCPYVCNIRLSNVKTVVMNKWVLILCCYIHVLTESLHRSHHFIPVLYMCLSLKSMLLHWVPNIYYCWWRQ